MFNSFRPNRLGHLRKKSISVVAILTIAGLGIALPTGASAEAQAITSSDNASATVGSALSFTITTTGMPFPSIKKMGKLPKGVRLTDNHDGTATLSGTPVSRTRGVYPRPSGGIYDSTMVATFGSDRTKQIVTQAFTLTVDQAATITSSATKSVRVGGFLHFVVKTVGYPKSTMSESGSWPSGVTFTNNGNGTATLAGTPTSGSAGTYPITITASNGVGSPATQGFSLMVRS